MFSSFWNILFLNIVSSQTWDSTPSNTNSRINFLIGKPEIGKKYIPFLIYINDFLHNEMMLAANNARSAGEIVLKVFLSFLKKNNYEIKDINRLGDDDIKLFMERLERIVEFEGHKVEYYNIIKRFIEFMDKRGLLKE